jgi:hypothetical protein
MEEHAIKLKLPAKTQMNFFMIKPFLSAQSFGGAARWVRMKALYGPQFLYRLKLILLIE